MRTALFELLRRWRRPIIASAVALALLQAFVAGFAAAQAAALAADFAGGAICHGAVNTEPEPNKQDTVCCDFCIATTPALLLPISQGPARLAFATDVHQCLPSYDAVAITHRAVRNGSSQAPPILT